MSLDRRDIHNSAVLKPRFTKRPHGMGGYFCQTYRVTKKHAEVKTKEGYDQCIDCGRIKRGDTQRGIHNSNLSR